MPYTVHFPQTFNTHSVIDHSIRCLSLSAPPSLPLLLDRLNLLSLLNLLDLLDLPPLPLCVPRLPLRASLHLFNHVLLFSLPSSLQRTNAPLFERAHSSLLG